MQETRRNNGGMASELVHKYVIVHMKGERTKMVRALSYASREASVLKQKKKFPPRIETSKQVFSPTRAATQQMLDSLVGIGGITASEVNGVKAMANMPASRFEVLYGNNKQASENDLRLAGVV